MKADVASILAIIEEIELLGEPRTFKTDVPLVDQGIDSLDMATIYLNTEEKFGLKIPDKDLDQLQSIDDIITYVNSRV